jgi:AcrR family transcriptional regulator
MSPRTKEQNKEIKQQKSLLIVEAALKLFAEDGYTSTSMQSIAKEAGVSKGNLYNYFESKEELLEGVLNHGLKQFADIYDSYVPELKTELDFEMAIRGNFELIKENENFWKLYYNMVAQPKVQELFQKVFTPFLEEYMKIFESYYTMKGDENPQATSLLLGSSLDGVSLGYIMMGEMYPLDAVIDQLIKKFK